MIISSMLNPPQKQQEIYPKTMLVSEIDTACDTVTAVDFNGNEWQFYGVEDWEIDDIVSCIMDTNGTTTIYDDKIVDVRLKPSVFGTPSFHIMIENSKPE